MAPVSVSKTFLRDFFFEKQVAGWLIGLLTERCRCLVAGMVMAPASVCFQKKREKFFLRSRLAGWLAGLLTGCLAAWPPGCTSNSTSTSTNNMSPGHSAGISARELDCLLASWRAGMHAAYWRTVLNAGVLACWIACWRAGMRPGVLYCVVVIPKSSRKHSKSLQKRHKIIPNASQRGVRIFSYHAKNISESFPNLPTIIQKITPATRNHPSTENHQRIGNKKTNNFPLEAEGKRINSFQN